MSLRQLGIAVVIVASLAPAACSSRPATVIVRGTVRYEGRPLDQGEIRFVPLAGTAAPTNGGRIVSGRYAVTARGGLLPGSYRVEIESRATSGDEPAMPAEGEGPPAAPPAIPSRYNSETTLEAAIQPEPREQSRDFDLRAE